MNDKIYEGVAVKGHRVKGAHYIEHITVIRGKMYRDVMGRAYDCIESDDGIVHIVTPESVKEWVTE
jgi:hypothetical protein